MTLLHTYEFLSSLLYQLKINISTDNFEIYDGGSPEAVQAAYEQHRSSWNFNLIWGSWKAREIKLSPFNRSCIGISSNSDYSVYLHVLRMFTIFL